MSALIVEPRSLKYLAEACGGELVQDDPQMRVSRICTDSRQIQPGDLFLALAGEKFDGHDYLNEVAAKGAAAFVVNREKVEQASRLFGEGQARRLPYVAVENTRAALGQIAARYRRDFSPLVVAVGGSNGKTTTKELLGAVLGGDSPVLRSEASFNNDIGVPLTLLKLDSSHRVAVLEVGTNHPGELAPLVRMVQPKFGVITSIGREHLEFFRDVDGVAEEEGWLAELLPADGCLFVNGDSPFTERIVRRTKARVVRVGFGEGNEWRATAVKMDERGTRFEVKTANENFSGQYRMQLLGRHQVVNALLALAAGVEAGQRREHLNRALAGCTPPKMRLQLWETGGVRVLDDSYNANADSMLAALATLRELPCAGRRIAVLGDMAELGEHGAAAHTEVGRRTAEAGVDALLAVGSMAEVLAENARSAGLRDVSVFADTASAGAALRAMARPGDLVLLKASRSTRIERVAEELKMNNPGTK
ncbi:MAG: UDP-N-acetylmuramoyl-tripeptide--D-alanyl-D-alanine ligase [Verrucomicrobia bacterium]|nr:UDP-N-acetylmuramoyl-tripeptide--D-alanyl-D-alanine ligase [Verrucomicrobiota bacterium]